MKIYIKRKIRPSRKISIQLVDMNDKLYKYFLKKKKDGTFLKDPVIKKTGIIDFANYKKFNKKFSMGGPPISMGPNVWDWSGLTGVESPVPTGPTGPTGPVGPTGPPKKQKTETLHIHPQTQEYGKKQARLKNLKKR